ncbi:MAG: leucine--tRNA ligase [Candidatus Aenigmarchaeota archaeon]|nr:leucine--tRNA ligase [Candidatus Aenigmarchaeota archaeon]
MDFAKIDKKWQAAWADSEIFQANIDPKKKKFFTSIIIPYVNGNIHIGHSFTYTRIDAYARFKRMQGFNTLLAEGFHATGEPILGAIERLKKNDQSQIETLKMYGATDTDLENFKKEGPEFAARFWMEKIIESSKLMGFSVDWRRKFVTAIDPAFNRFIEWQYNTLRKKGYVIQGTHPVIWCPHDQSPTGDHDRLEGEGESPTEFILLKFQIGDRIVPCATLRPETIYGVTNLWINPNAEYVKAQVGKETWIISKEAVEKFKDQLRDITITGSVSVKELIGKYARNPLTDAEIIILPGDFVDAATATGVVMSVPAHAPYDYVALEELKKNTLMLKKYGIGIADVKKIEPISVIKVDGFGEHPAVDISEKMGIKSASETDKLDEATSQLYKKEYHTGVTREIAGKFSGKKVSEIKDALTDDFVKRNSADKMWDPSNIVVCRCTNRCHVKILENQWFLKFSDKDWKEKVKRCIAQMKFYPEGSRMQFLNTVDWLDDKACARKSGLGTRLPWDKEWIVETLSDSVIYMAYYTIAGIINADKISAENLTDEVFDYVFLGKGELKQVAKNSGIDEKTIEAMKEEFEYFYPVDMRNSAKELVQNHLTYALFHHVAIWDNPKYWPKSYGINGFVTVSGEKMAKSKGNIIPLKELVAQHGADLVRINIATSNENMDDADWREDSLKTFSSRLKFLEAVVDDFKKAERQTTNALDIYMTSVMQESVKGATENYEVMKFRSGAQYSMFQLLNEMRHYIDRCGGIEHCNRTVLGACLSTALKLIAPFTSHISEELWSRLGNKDFIAVSKWPEFDKSRIDAKVVELENIFKKTHEDINNILKLAGKKKNAYLYFVTDKEVEYFEESATYLKHLFGFEKLVVHKASDKNKYDPQNKSPKAKYGKPAIYLE